MMAQVPREAPSYSAAAEYYGADYPPAQVQGDPAAFHRPQRQLSEDALADVLEGMEIARGKQAAPHNKELVVHAIEAAASVLKDQASALRDQLSENERLRSALRVREWELQNYRIDQGQGARQTDNPSQEESQTFARLQQPTTSERNPLLQGPDQNLLWAGNGFTGDPQSSLIFYPNVQSLRENPYHYSSNGAQNYQYGPNFGANGVIRRNLPDGVFSHTSSATAISMSPIRLSREGETGARLQPRGGGNTQLRQDLVKRAPTPQDEIKQLKNLLSDCTSKEMQLVHENHMLETRMSELRLTIEKYQQELVDATSREASIRQDILEENARLRGALQDIHYYESSLMPLLADYNVQPATRDPYAIVSGIKVLVQSLREEVRKDAMPAKQPWRNSHGYPSSPSPMHPISWTPKSPERPPGLEIVPQASYLQPDRPLSPCSPLAHNPGNWESPRTPTSHHPFDNYTNENVRLSAYAPQTAESGIPQRSVPYNDVDEESAERPERPSPHLPSVREEATSSLSDEEDPLPDIEGLSINGDTILGSKIQASGISINGTTLCHFQWVRHHQNGSFFHIPGAAQPEYTITADDVDTILSLECTPMDDRNRKGEMVQVSVNDHTTIMLDPELKDQIIEYLDNGQANFEVKLVVESAQEVLFEPASLSLKRSIYELKKLNGKKIIGSERYASESAVEIKVGKDSQCAIINTGIMHLLDCGDNRKRDLLVLTMREFIKAAVDKKRAKKRLWLK